jgi:hypothetical protein
MRLIFHLLFSVVAMHLCVAQTVLSPSQKFNDTVVLMNGELIPCLILDSTLYGAKIMVQDKKGKTHEVLLEGERVFSLKFSNGTEKIIYKMGTNEDDTFTEEEAKLFITGERDAKKGFRSPGATIGGGIVGLASGSVGTMLSLIPPFIYSGIMLIPKVRIKHKTVSNESYLQHDAYLLGYERVARKNKAINSFKSGMLGVAVGLLFNQFVFK